MEHTDFGSQVNVQQRTVTVKAYLSGSESPSDEGSDCDENFGLEPLEKPKRFSDMRPDYFSILKSAKYIKMARDKSCLAALCIIHGSDLTHPANLPALFEKDTLEMMVNLCEVNDLTCVTATLKILNLLTKNGRVAVAVVNLGIIPTCVKLLTSNALDLMEDSLEIIANVGYLRRAEKACRRLGGIEIIVSLLEIDKGLLVARTESLNDEEKGKVAVVTSAAKALWVLARFSKNKTLMLKTGIVPYLTQVLLSGNSVASVPVTGILSECSNVFRFQIAIETEGLVGVLLDNLTKNDVVLQWTSAACLMRAADGNEEVRDMIRFNDGIKLIVNLVKNSDPHDHKLMAAAIGAVWKSSITEKNGEVFERMGIVHMIEPFISDTNMNVKISAVGAMGQLAKILAGRKSIAKGDIIAKIVHMLDNMNDDLVANAVECLGNVSLDPDGMKIIENHDGVRLVWSLLRHRNVELRIKALWAIKPMVTLATDAGELIRQLTGSLELLINMLKSVDLRVLTAACAVIGEVALDYENLCVMTDQGVVRHLTSMAEVHGSIALRREVCSAICNCCNLPCNVSAFGHANVIPILSQYLPTKDEALLEQVCRCFEALSRDAMNCVIMHSCQIVSYLLCATESSHAVTQMSAADCLANIRRTLLRYDQKKVLEPCLESPSEESAESKEPQGPSTQPCP